VSQPFVAVVVNPERREELEQFLAAVGERPLLEVVEPDGFDEFTRALSDAGGSFDVVAAIGGDGTQRTAAHELKNTDAALAIVPAGTVNLLGRVLGIASIDDAAEAVVQGHRRTIDTGFVLTAPGAETGEDPGETFVLQASTGYDAAVMERLDDGAKRWGRLGYFATGVRTLRSHRPRHVRVDIDGRTCFSGRAMSVMVTNVSARGSADFDLAPDSAFDDGRLDVVIQRCDSAPTMLRAMWALYRERTPRPDDVLVEHGEHVEVEWSTAVPCQRDGDAVGRCARARYRIDPASLTVLVPHDD
jgi:diacylglycerol kinase family enzyme